jgi:hypothetical protein
MSIKNTLILVLLSIITVSFSANAQSNSATATARATIVAPIALEKTADLEFGSISASAEAGSVTIPALPGNIVRTANGGISFFGFTGTVSAACFKVTGTLLQTYVVSFPSTVELIHTDGVTKMSATNFESSLSTANNIGAVTVGELSNVYVGATLQVGASQKAGLYESAAFEVSVNYN